jgi:ubiquinone/menaquinone biosynthesis C-methylase UbiE
MSKGITGFTAGLYARLAKRTPILKDFCDAAAEEVLKKLSSGTVLDVGTGPGYLPIKVALSNSCLNVLGLDISKDMIRISRKKLRENHVENVQLIVGDIEKTALVDESVDLAVATLSFHHWASPARAFEELFRILKQKGEIWIYELNGKLTPQSKAWIKRNYNIITRAVAPAIMKMGGGHAITLEQAESILEEYKGKFTQISAQELELPLVKMVLTKP